VSVKVVFAEPIAIAPAPSGSSVLSVALAWWVVTFTTHAVVRGERRACRVVLPGAILRWQFREVGDRDGHLVCRGKDKVGEIGFFDHTTIETSAVE
jgi:hypothetical protein